MKAAEITLVVLEALGEYRLVRLNYANGDMVGHTGSYPATVKAVEAVDREIGRLLAPVLEAGGALIITADHGNADEMAERDKKTKAIKRDADGNMIPRTSHSLNPVPCHIVLGPADQERFALAAVEEPGLGHVAATAALLLGFDRPEGFLPSLLEVVR